jgi:hypothetical protein
MQKQTKQDLILNLLDYLKCGEAMKSGISFHPESPYAKICADVVVRYPRVQECSKWKSNQSK